MDNPVHSTPAAKLGAAGKGVPRNITPQERERRRLDLVKAREAASKRKATPSPAAVVEGVRRRTEPPKVAVVSGVRRQAVIQPRRTIVTNTIANSAAPSQ